MTSALRWGWVISNTPQPLYPPERPCTHFTGGWVDPRAGLEGCGKSCPPPGFDPRTVQPVASRYTDWAIAAHYLLIGEQVFFCSRLQQWLLTRNMTYDRLILRILTKKFVEIGINSALITWYRADSFFNILSSSNSNPQYGMKNLSRLSRPFDYNWILHHAPDLPPCLLFSLSKLYSL